MSNLDDILKPHLEQFEKNMRKIREGSPYTSGVLGMVIDSSAIVIDPTNPSKYYVRLPDGSFTRALHQGRVAPVYNQPVDIKRNALGIYEITGITRGQEEAAANNDESSFVGPHILGAHTDVDLSGITDGDVLAYNASLSEWTVRSLRKLDVSTDDVGNPPTDAELDSIYGIPSDNTGLLYLLDDNAGDTDVYLITSNGTSWWVFTGTKAI